MRRCDLYCLKSIAAGNLESDNIVNPSASVDLGKARGILSLADLEALCGIGLKAIRGESIDCGRIVESININDHDRLSETELLSLLFYMGFLTISRESRSRLCVPNRAVIEQFFEYCFQCLRGTDQPFGSTTTSAIRSERSSPTIPSLSSGVMTRACGNHANLHLKESDMQTALLMGARLERDYCVKAPRPAGGAGRTERQRGSSAGRSVRPVSSNRRPSRPKVSGRT